MCEGLTQEHGLAELQSSCTCMWQVTGSCCTTEWTEHAERSTTFAGLSSLHFSYKLGLWFPEIYDAALRSQQHLPVDGDSKHAGSGFAQLGPLWVVWRASCWAWAPVGPAWDSRSSVLVGMGAAEKQQAAGRSRVRAGSRKAADMQKQQTDSPS